MLYRLFGADKPQQLISQLGEGDSSASVFVESMTILAGTEDGFGQIFNMVGIGGYGVNNRFYGVVAKLLPVAGVFFVEGAHLLPDVYLELLYWGYFASFFHFDWAAI